MGINIGDRVRGKGFEGLVVGARTDQEFDPIKDDTRVCVDSGAGTSHECPAGDLEVLEPASQEVLDAQAAHVAERERVAKLSGELVKEYPEGKLYFAGYAAGAFVGLVADPADAAALPGVDEVLPCTIDGVVLATRGADALDWLAVKHAPVAEAAVAALDAGVTVGALDLVGGGKVAPAEPGAVEVLTK